MRGGALLDLAEMERVSALFDVDKIGGAITGGLLDGNQVASGPTGVIGRLGDLQEMTLGDRLQTGGGRRKRTHRRGRKTYKRGKPRFRLNLRASIRWRSSRK